MLAGYGYIAILLVAAITIPILLLLLARFISTKPKKPDVEGVKTDTYECGMKTIGSSWIQFNFRYYFYALIFLALDVLVIFLYPWAVYLRQLGLFSLITVLILIVIILIGYIYAWKKKVLEWK